MRVTQYGLLELARGIHGVSQAPGDRPLALYTLDERAEDVGAVPTHAPLVDETSETACTRKHTQQGRLGQTHRRIAVVDENDLVASKSELVSATGTGAVDCRQKPDS